MTPALAVSSGSSCAPASAAASASDWRLRWSRYHDPTSMTRPAIPSRTTIQTAESTTAWPASSRHLLIARFAPALLRPTPTLLSAWHGRRRALPLNCRPAGCPASIPRTSELHEMGCDDPDRQAEGKNPEPGHDAETAELHEQEPIRLPGVSNRGARAASVSRSAPRFWRGAVARR